MLKRLLLASLLMACSTPIAEDGVTASSNINSNKRQYDSSRGKKIADKAKERIKTTDSGGRCLAEVQNTLEAAGEPHFPRLEGAVDLDNYLKGKGDSLISEGFQKQQHDFGSIPVGSIIAWRPSQCGYHATYGHIEIVTDATHAVSDFRGTIRTDCGAPNIYVPVKDEAASTAVEDEEDPVDEEFDESEEDEVESSPSTLKQVKVSWNLLDDDIYYSLDVMTDSGDLIGPCVDVTRIKQKSSYTFKGTCVSPDIEVGIDHVRDFRICSAKWDDWKNGATCTDAHWDRRSSKVKISNR